MDGLNGFWDQVWCLNFYKGQVFKCLFCDLNAKVLCFDSEEKFNSCIT